ncbi:MAG: hypothetical protein ACKO91_03275 [Acidimicrobiales bacterium]
MSAWPGRWRVVSVGSALGALVGLAGIVVGIVGAAPAQAHGGTAVVTVEQAAPGPGGVDVRVQVQWSDDGHAATEATVTGLLVARDGTGPTPVVLRATDDQGRYAGVLPATPGTWTLRVTVVRPPGVFEQPVEVPAPAPVAPATTPATVPATTTPASATPATTAPATTTPATTPTTTAPAATTTPPERTARRGGGVPWRRILSIGVPLGVVIGGATVVMVGRRRNRTG